MRKRDAQGYDRALAMVQQFVKEHNESWDKFRTNEQRAQGPDPRAIPDGDAVHLANATIKACDEMGVIADKRTEAWWAVNNWLSYTPYRRKLILSAMRLILRVHGIQ